MSEVARRRLGILILILTLTAVSRPPELFGGGEQRVVKLLEGHGMDALSPVINDRGEVAFSICNSSEASENGIWFVSADGETKQIVGAEWQLPSSRSYSRQGHDLFLNNNGQVAFSVDRDATAVSGAWVYDPDRGIEVIATKGMAVPGMEGKVFRGVVDGVIGLTSGDKPAATLWAIVVNADDDSDLEATRMLWRKEIGGELRRIAADVSIPDDSKIQVTRRGDVLIKRLINGYVTQQSSLTLSIDAISIPVAYTGDQFELRGKEVTIDSISSSDLSENHVVFNVSLDEAPPALLRYGASGLKPVFYRGVKFDGKRRESRGGMSGLLINRLGNVVLYSRYSSMFPPGIIYCARDAPLKVLIDSEQPAFGTQLFFNALVSPSEEGRDTVGEEKLIKLWHHEARRGRTSPFSGVALNGRNQCVFLGVISPRYSDGVIDGSNLGIWIVDAERGAQHLVLRTGEEIEVAKGDVRTIASISLARAGSSSAPRGLNERGRLTYAVQFVDGTAAVVIDDRYAAVDRLAGDGKRRVEQAQMRAARQAYANWEVMANERLAMFEGKKQDSDQYKLEQIAIRLKGQYRTRQERLADLLDSDQGLDAISHATQVKELRTRILRLPAIWRQLSDWPFQERIKAPSSDDREFGLKTTQLLCEYGWIPEIKQKVNGKFVELRNVKPIPIQFVGRDLGSRGFTLNGDGRCAEAFDGPIGELQPGLFAKPAENSIRSKLAITPGPLTTLRKEIARLTKLSIAENGRLYIDRLHWTDDIGNITRVQASEAAHEILEKAGIHEESLYPENVREIRAEGHFELHPYADAPAVIQLFEELKSVARGWGENSGKYSTRLRSETLNGQLEIIDGDLKVELEERKNPFRILTIVSRDKGSMRIRIESNDEFHLLLQQRNGAIHWLTGLGPETKVYAHDNFAALYRSNPELVAGLIETLNAYGVVGPVRHTDPGFHKAVVSRIKGMSPTVRQTVEREVQKLDSSSFEQREAAFRVLARNASVYCHVLEDLREEVSSLETRTRINRIVDFAKQESSQYDRLIDLLETTSSEAQLAGIIKRANGEERAILQSYRQMISRQRPSD